jgi:Rod binding domain-containing protein
MATSPAFNLASAQTTALQTREDNLIQRMKIPASGNDDAKIEKGAKEFESILVGSWLQQAEQSFATLPGAEDDQDPGRDSMMSLGVQTLSTAMTASGGLGIAKMIAKAMHAQADKANAQPAASTSRTGNQDSHQK